MVYKVLFFDGWGTDPAYYLLDSVEGDTRRCSCNKLSTNRPASQAPASEPMQADAQSEG